MQVQPVRGRGWEVSNTYTVSDCVTRTRDDDNEAQELEVIVFHGFDAEQHCRGFKSQTAFTM